MSAVASEATAKNITIDYMGAAPANATISVSASGNNTVLGTPANPFYDVEFDISGLTAAQARNYVLTGRAPGKPNKPALTSRTNAAIDAAGTGIDLNTIDAIGVFGTRFVAVTEVDVRPNDAARRAAGRNFAIAALDPRQNNSAGPINVAVLGVGTGFTGGGPLGTNGAGAGQLLLTLNGLPITVNLVDGESNSQAAGDLFAALRQDGFALAPPDAFGDVELDFSNSTNFALLGSPSSFDISFVETGDNLDISLDTFLVTEPGPLMLLGPAILGLGLCRARAAKRLPVA
jgi:hypothetical protein